MAKKAAAKKAAAKKKLTTAELTKDALWLLEEGSVPEYVPDCPIDFETMLDTGVGPLNLWISGRYYGGIPRGTCVRYSGKASSGKTYNLLTMAACASHDPNYDDYDVVYDDVEHGLMMDLNKFGRKTRERLIPIRSATLEEAYLSLIRRMKTKPVVYFMDSTDALSSMGEVKKTGKRLNAKNATELKELGGDMGDGKAAIHSKYMRQLEDLWLKTGSIVVLVSQYRDDLKSISGSGKESGGRALEHYPSIHIRTSVVEKKYKEINGQKRHYANIVEATVSKTRVIGGGGNKVRFPLYFDSGIDDIEAAIDYLILEEHWEGSESTVIAPEFNFEGSILTLIVQLQEMPEARRVLDRLCTQVWVDVKQRMTTARKPRFQDAE